MPDRWFLSLPKLLWEAGHRRPSVSATALGVLLAAATAAGPGTAAAARLAQVEPTLGPFFALVPAPGKKGPVRAGPFLSLPAEARTEGSPRAPSAAAPALSCA